MKTFVILVAVDFSTADHPAVLRALELAAAYPLSAVHVVTVTPLGAVLDPGEEPRVAARLREVTTQAVMEFDAHRGPRATSVMIHVVSGGVAHAIVELATELGADLVLVGSHGRRGIARALHGSVAERVVRFAPCPVLVVRDGRASKPPAKAAEPCDACAGIEATSGGRERSCPAHARAGVGT